MNLELDLAAKALYLRLANGRVAGTIELADAVVADVDEAGTVLGLEFVRVDRFASFVTSHPDLVALPDQLTYTSVDRDKSWQTAIDSRDNGANGEHQARIAELNGMFLRDLVADPGRVDRIADGETIILHPTIARN